MTSSDTVKHRVGVWLIGARGGLATTVIAGARLIARGLVAPTGLLTETGSFRELDLVPVPDLVFGGHEIRGGGLVESALQIGRESRTLDPARIEAIRADLEAVDAEVITGTAWNCGPAIDRLGTPATRSRPESVPELVGRLEADIAGFRERHGLERVVVVNLASTEPVLPRDPRLADPDALEGLLEAGEEQLRASTLYAWAAVSAGCPFINFTPNRGSLLPGIQSRALAKGVPIMGNDGKTGETLVKSALAPMFRDRALRVLSWQGYNMLGDRDGEVLADDLHKEAKVASKDALLPQILGYPLHTHVGIDYVPSLKDNKTAWDFIHFQGFLDHPMTMQFTWQGCDAILAAPLVLDMLRLTDHAHRRGESGLMTWLAPFFKSPVGFADHDLQVQMAHLREYVADHLRGRA